MELSNGAVSQPGIETNNQLAARSFGKARSA